MSERAVGTFEVALTPVSADGEPSIGKMSIEKEFEGDLAGRSDGIMLSVGTETPEASGYVAIEKVVGTLHGRSGTFVLQHLGTMSRGVGELTITVVPDSGTDDLVGLTGSMTIDIVDGRHDYVFEYSL